MRTHFPSFPGGVISTKEEGQIDESFTTYFIHVPDGRRPVFGSGGPETRRSEEAAAKGSATGDQPAAEESATRRQ